MMYDQLPLESVVRVLSEFVPSLRVKVLEGVPMPVSVGVTLVTVKGWVPFVKPTNLPTPIELVAIVDSVGAPLASFQHMKSLSKFVPFAEVPIHRAMRLGVKGAVRPLVRFLKSTRGIATSM